MLSGYNLVSLVIAENREMLSSGSMEKCSLRNMYGVRRTEFYSTVSIRYSPFPKIQLNLATKNRKTVPCNVNCESCK